MFELSALIICYLSVVGRLSCLAFFVFLKHSNISSSSRNSMLQTNHWSFGFLGRWVVGWDSGGEKIH